MLHEMPPCNVLIRNITSTTIASERPRARRKRIIENLLTSQTKSAASRSRCAATTRPKGRIRPRARRLFCNHLGSYLNFCPPMLASYIKPPLATVKVPIHLWYAPAVVAAFLVALAPAEAPVELAFPLALAVMAVACASAPNSKLPLVNSLNAR